MWSFDFVNHFGEREAFDGSWFPVETSANPFNDNCTMSSEGDFLLPTQFNVFVRRSLSTTPSTKPNSTISEILDLKNSVEKPLVASLQFRTCPEVSIIEEY